MADPKGFLKYKREQPKSRKPEERVKDYQEIYEEFSDKKVKTQAARCMDCGVPFCQSGCPLGNVIPDFNDAVYENDWENAYHILSQTNNFPEFTGRICPAPCESKCVLGINQSPVSIELIEKNIIETAFEKGYIQPNPPILRTGKKVAVVGSGPAGMAAAAQLNQEGHLVTVYEKNTRVGGLLRYGIPDFKLEKWVVERRVQLMEAEGIRFEVNAEVGGNVPVEKLMNEYDAIVLCGGSSVPRKIGAKGEDLKGVHFAMEFLEQNNKRVAGDKIPKKEELLATGKHVVVIGGGDTGSDCIGTSNRHGAKSILQLEIMAAPPTKRPKDIPWTAAPMLLKTTSSHEEGCEREWGIMTKEFVSDKKGNVKGIKLVNVELVHNAKTGRMGFEEIEGTERELPCDLALLAVGYLHPQKEGLLEKMDIELTERGNVKDDNYQTNVEKIFTAGDMRRGQSLVVWAIAEGRKAAEAVNGFLVNTPT